MLAKSFKSLKTLTTVANRTMSSGQPKRVVVTGAAGQISYATLFRIARYAILSLSTEGFIHHLSFSNIFL